LQTLTEKDKAILQMGTENVYQKFISKVSANRNMTLEEVDKIAQGKVWIGEKALEIGLIDVLGDQKAAIEAAAELANISDDYDIIFVERDDPFSEFTKAFGLRILNNTFSIIDYFGYSVKTILNHPLVNWIGIQTKQLEQFNDPRGIYLNCYCEIE